MTGQMIAMGPCFICRVIFTFDTDFVVSVDGSPICKDCAEKVNEGLVRAGKPPVAIYDKGYL